ncbi:hypothetical protein J4771_02610 [Candidatus Kaistella beijingensis]|uniref:hypothetical protein n=1 Tax=Candidatus Kaistella beijingensis TaxID=2820270 RepID=UPI001CC57B02|nr:hypothetical protein [Candidatus Kaistella beijingensis]UBB90269.1 hypothetical protein J4771_02610 [Candidatus Kaistella beijingensis]
MKTLFILVLSIISNLFCSQEKFDIVTFQPPKNWAKSSTAETLTFSKDDTNGNFCVMTLYKSIEAGNDAKKNFDISWKSLVQEILKTSDATMQPSVNDNGWETQIGSAPFNKDGLIGAAILMTSSKNSKMMNILILTNTENFQNEMETFLDSVTFMKTENSKVKPTSSNAQQNMETPKHEVWMSYKYNMSRQRYVPAFILKYSNGDCLDYLPEEGILGFSKATDPVRDRHWGKAENFGKEIHITFPGYVRKLGIESASKMSYPPNDKVTFYFKSVAIYGLKLAGEWSSGGSFADPNWFKNPNYSDGTIQFFADGRFENKKGFVGMKKSGSGFIHRDEGKGTYQIKDFTLILTYDDGEVWTSALTGLKDVDPKSDNSILFFRDVPFFKKLK